MFPIASGFGVQSRPVKNSRISASSPVCGRPSLAWVPAALIAIGALVAYHASFRVPFVLDDASAVLGNRSIEDIRNLGAVFAPPNDLTTAGRPLLNLSFALNYAVHGRTVAGYHAVNLALHIGAGLLLFGIVRAALHAKSAAIDMAGPVATAVALLWTVHPVHTASVTYVSQRAEVLMGFWFFFTLWAFARGQDRGPGWLAVAVVGCAAGMASKETMVTAPAAVLLYDATFFAAGIRDALRRRAPFYAGLAGTWLILAALMWSTRVTSRGIGYTAAMDFWTHALTQACVLVHYLKLTVWPDPLVFDHGPEIAVQRIADARGEILLLVVAVVAISYVWRRARAAGFAAAMFFVPLIPSIAVPVTHQPMAENRLYVPLAAVAALVGAAVWRNAGRARVLVLGLITLALLTIAVRRHDDYTDPVGLWMDTVAKRPANVRARSHLGEALRAAGDMRGAVEQLQAALKLNPNYPAVHNNLGLVYSADPAMHERAIGHFEQALRLDPSSAHLHNNFGVVLALIPGRDADAIRQYRHALRLRPDYADAHKNLANVLVRQPGGAAEGVREYAEALRLRPNDADAHANLAFGLAVSGRSIEARRHFETALRLNPEHVEAHANFGNLLSQTPNGLAAAISHYRRAVEIDPKRADAWANLGLALARAGGRREDAITALERALEFRPDFPAAQATLEQLRKPR